MPPARAGAGAGILLGLMPAEALGASETARVKFSVNKPVCSIGDCWTQHALLAGSSHYLIEECTELQL